MNLGGFFVKRGACSGVLWTLSLALDFVKFCINRVLEFIEETYPILVILSAFIAILAVLFLL